MAKLIKIFLWILFLAALAGLDFWLVRIKGQPWWFAAALSAGLIAIPVGILYLKKVLIRGRERQFVQRVIDQDSEAIQRAPVSQRHELMELQEHWKKSVKRLQHSHLRKMGNPLYVLPWFLIMGESKTGKTSAVKNACQSTPMSEISRSSGLAGTRNCDWWFFDQAIILDTAGRYTIPIDEGSDLEEWKQFLMLLAKYRKREPLNGVIVAIAADKLVKADEARVVEEGQSIRRRVDQMMRIMGAKFPVYILITKMDLVHGFCEFNTALPPEYVGQTMGYTNTALRPYWRDVLDDAVGSIGRRLHQLRFLLVHREASPAPGAMMFPTEFNRMVGGMRMFLEAVFAENPYQETPMFRGLYFSSAVRKDRPASEFLEVAGLEAHPGDDPSPGAGLFLKDFFAGILPRDRDLFKPLREFVLWRRMTRNLGLLSWMLICLAMFGFLGLSYYHNHTTIQSFRQAFYDPPVLTMDTAADLLMLEKMRLEILEMEKKNNFWGMPRFGLDHSVRMVDELKGHYLRLFGDDLLKPLDQRVMKDIERGGAEASGDAFVDHAGYVVAQIGVLSAHLDGNPPPKGNEFHLITANLLKDLDPGLIDEIADKFADAYYAYLDWSNDRTAVVSKLQAFRITLADLIEKRGRDLRWLVHGWIPETVDIHPQDFFGTAADNAKYDGLHIPGAFTEEGRQHIRTFIDHIKTSLGTRDKQTDTSTAAVSAAGEAATRFNTREQEFWNWYRQEFFRQWYAFISDFPKVIDHIRDDATRQRLALLMTTGQNPYFNLIRRAGDEIKALGDVSDGQDFSAMILRINQVMDAAETESKKQTSVTAKIASKTAKLEEAVQSRTDKSNAEKMARTLEQAHAWNAYMQALEKITFGISSPEQGYQMYKDLYAATDAQTAGNQPPLLEADYAYRKLKTMMTTRTDAPVIWDLVFGPQDFLMTLAAAKASCYLQDQWHEQVLSYLQGVDPDKVPKLLFDKQDGLVWKFLESSAKSFIARNKSGYVPRRDFRGHSLPFRPGFMHFLNKGQKAVIEYQPEYRVDLETVPLKVDPGAKDEPFAAILKVNCADTKFILENYNYPQKATIRWDPSQCGDTSLSIEFSNFALHREYNGNLGFAKFLAEFKDGSHTFTADDFPERAPHLKQAGITGIGITYKISGARAIVDLLSHEPEQVPEKITMCRDGR